MDIETRAENPRFLVFEGRPGAAGTRPTATLERALASVESDGWIVVRGWAAPLRRDRIVCTAWIRTPDDARRALLAAVSGARLVVGIAADRDTVDRFLDDLRRLGPVDYIHATATGAHPRDARQRALLGLMSEGLTVREAAGELGMSARTATRRLAAARAAVDVAADKAAPQGIVPASRAPRRSG